MIDEYAIGDTLTATYFFDLPFLYGEHQVEFEKMFSGNWKPIHFWNIDGEVSDFNYESSVVYFGKPYFTDNAIKELTTDRYDTTGDVLESMVWL